MITVLTNENDIAVSRIGSALEADKKINLAGWIFVIVHVAKAMWSSPQGRPADVRGDALYPACGLSLAGFAGHLRAVEFSLYSLAALVSGRTVGTVAGGAGAEGQRQAAVSGCQSRQGTSGWEQPRWRPAKSGHWTHQGRSEHQDQCLGGRLWASCKLEFGSGTARRCERGPSGSAPRVARHDHGRRQGLRQRWIPRAVGSLGESFMHSAAQQPPQACTLASWSLPKTTQGGKPIPTVETLPQSWDA